MSSSILLASKYLQPNFEVLDVLRSLKFESSAFAFVCFEISSFRRVEISKQTNAKADDSNLNNSNSDAFVSYVFCKKRTVLYAKR